jgi:hypothetical protein
VAGKISAANTPKVPIRNPAVTRSDRQRPEIV